MLTNTERSAIRAELADATAKRDTARDGLRAAKATHAEAISDRTAIIAKAASVGGVPAADIHLAGRKVTETASLVEIAELMLSAADDRQNAARVAFQAMDGELIALAQRAAIDKRIAAAGRLDAAIAMAEEALADMDDTSTGKPEHSYVLSLTRQKPDSSHWRVHNLRDLAQIERAVHGI